MVECQGDVEDEDGIAIDTKDFSFCSVLISSVQIASAQIKSVRNAPLLLAALGGAGGVTSQASLRIHFLNGSSRKQSLGSDEHQIKHKRNSNHIR